MRNLLFLLVIYATPVTAQDRMTGTEFDAHVTGRTVTYRTMTAPNFGIERYMEGRRVMWSSQEGICQYGVWFESKGNICFRYDHDPEPKCWTLYMEQGAMRGVYTNKPPYTVIYERPERNDPLICNDLSS